MVGWCVWVRRGEGARSPDLEVAEGVGHLGGALEARGEDLAAVVMVVCGSWVIHLFVSVDPSTRTTIIRTHARTHARTYMRRAQGDEGADEARAVVSPAVVGGGAEVEAGDPPAGAVGYL